MSLIVAIYVPTGIVVSADSRTMVTRTAQTGAEEGRRREITQFLLSDSTEKVLVLRDRFVVATWGDAFVGNLPVAHHIREFDRGGPEARGVAELAEGLLGHFREQEQVPRTSLLVAGHDGGEPLLCAVDVPSGSINRANKDAEGRTLYGILRGGDTDIVDRLLSNEALLPPFHLMNLQDAADYSRHLIRTTIDEMRFEPKTPTVGGPIDTLVLEPGAGPAFLIRKTLRP